MAVLPTGAENWTLDTVLEFGLNVVNFIATFAGYTAIIVLIWASIQYFMGARTGEKGETAKGKTMLTWAIVGIVVILLAKIIIAQFLTILDIRSAAQNAANECVLNPDPAKCPATSR
ncbi:hypothetical protein GW889_01105 [Candidatus Berkelbacteria bacterium]|uniref:Uncharacterized protein n=1 Tax=Candidatus Berkelbacteria bacterium CG10_big_fil_rev_8_21_14_0_10_43_14 TaxID=1974515 RepID=A0A2M6R911_9BACT|nr:hypothetical protein [Candidatus Berkelbacteria bacterium]OIP06306.1 MAG: hypothetical protein AUK41_02875 [Candidatus Berkelbacteria bacterium CG2_30_43_20]PIS07088.1 MAG: hypothetical protein COT79_01100 [Candidatus Berkelbacteria bacterium CG10_big_fil_rev_8_21_14_0_10_43_14]